MTRRRDISVRRYSLDEIREIMNSMKNLAYMESRKISGFLESQRAVVASMETAARDFLGFYPDTMVEPDDVSLEVYILVGTERGFCGDLNRGLLNYFDRLLQDHGDDKVRLISVGHKMQSLLQDDARVIQHVEGASVVEEVSEVLNRLVNQLAAIQHEYASMTLYVVYHDEQQRPVHNILLPPFQQFLHQPPLHRHAPILNLEPRQFLRELSHQYLFATLHAMLYTSLMAENRRRVSHLEGAVQHMQEQIENMRHQDNVLRQEEIIEEIEVILLRSGDSDLS
jgi:F-type H+-transporting ATPase subunit gamma